MPSNYSVTVSVHLFCVVSSSCGGIQSLFVTTYPVVSRVHGDIHTICEHLPCVVSSVCGDIQDLVMSVPCRILCVVVSIWCPCPWWWSETWIFISSDTMSIWNSGGVSLLINVTQTCDWCKHGIYSNTHTHTYTHTHLHTHTHRHRQADTKPSLQFCCISVCDHGLALVFFISYDTYWNNSECHYPADKS